uniref:Uncharacterized protein n=1 Tax=Arundo donax TaxID=35708 RepID=A0A0A9AFC6_ARUDO
MEIDHLGLHILPDTRNNSRCCYFPREEIFLDLISILVKLSRDDPNHLSFDPN